MTADCKMSSTQLLTTLHGHDPPAPRNWKQQPSQFPPSLLLSSLSHPCPLIPLTGVARKCSWEPLPSSLPSSSSSVGGKQAYGLIFSIHFLNVFPVGKRPQYTDHYFSQYKKKLPLPILNECVSLRRHSGPFFLNIKSYPHIPQISSDYTKKSRYIFKV